MSRRSLLFIAPLFVLAVGAFAWHVAHNPMDFRVYYFGAEGVFNGTRPVYGQQSGIGWPMHYRYPPLFLFIALPFTWVSLPAASALWLVLKSVALTSLILVIWKRLGPPKSNAAWLVPMLFAGPYIVEDLRYGNAQSFIFVLTGAALLLLQASPTIAAGALALAISVKVWPFFFVPYLAARGEWKTVGRTLAFVAILLVLPSLYFGIGRNFQLLSQWAEQEFSTQTGETEIWFPSQSLRGVMMRYLTAVDYSRVPDSNYQAVNVITMPANTVRSLWIAVDALAYAGFLLITARRHRSAPFGSTEALAFSALVLLQPFSQKYALVVLVWSAMVAGRFVKEGRARVLLYAAIALTVVQPLVSGAAAQRLFQVLGFDFFATALLASFLTIRMVQVSQKD